MASVNSVFLQNYRNYEQQKISFSDGVNLIYGENAQGKTNLLESVFLFSAGKSHRNVKDAQLIHADATFARLVLSFCMDQKDKTAEMHLFHDKRKEIKIEGNKIARLYELMGAFLAVFFCPEDLLLIKGNPSERRRYLDMLISRLRPKYFLHLQRYNKLLEQRNKLLKEPHPDTVMLEVWDEKMAEDAAAILKFRAAFVAKLLPLCETLHHEISLSKETLNIRYHTFSESADKAAVIAALERAREKDLQYKMTTVGPHRDDLLVSINNREVKLFASQGQQRTAALSMKLAEAACIEQETGEVPVLLLDDVLSELDEARQDFVVNKLYHGQVLLACTELPKQFEKNCNLLHIEQGRLI